MNDLINRLRDTASKGVSVWGDLQIEAAKEIEILTAEREAYASAMDRMKAEVEALNAKLTYANEVIDQRNAEIKRGHEDFIQAVTDPENQPSQFGTVTMAMYESIRVDRDGLHKAWESAFGDRSFEEVQSEVEALRADAERYRFLQIGAYVGIAPHPKPHEVWCLRLPNPKDAANLDQAIDAAMSAQEE